MTISSSYLPMQLGLGQLLSSSFIVCEVRGVMSVANPRFEIGWGIGSRKRKQEGAYIPEDGWGDEDLLVDPLPDSSLFAECLGHSVKL